VGLRGAARGQQKCYWAFFCGARACLCGLDIDRKRNHTVPPETNIEIPSDPDAPVSDILCSKPYNREGMEFAEIFRKQRIASMWIKEVLEVMTTGTVRAYDLSDTIHVLWFLPHKNYRTIN